MTWTLGERVAAGLIVLCGAGALALDIAFLPTGDRVGLPDAPGLYGFASLVLCASALSLNLRSWQAAVWAAVGLSGVLLFVPIVTVIQGIDISTLLIRRSWLVCLVWVVALSSTLQQRRAASLEHSRSLARRAVEQLEGDNVALNEKLLALTNVAFDGVVVAEDGVIVEASAPTAKQLGYTIDEVVGVSIFDYVAPAFRESARRTSQQEYMTAPEELALVAKDGALVYVEYFAANVRIAGRVQRVIGLRNIGERISTERLLARTAEAERNRIGLDLHDHVGQILIGTKWAAERLSQRLAAADPDGELQEQARRVLVFVDAATTEIRRLSTRLAPQVLDSEAIGPALEALCAAIESSHNRFRCRLHCHHTGKLESADVAIHAYRIAEEAVGNAVRHSGGDCIDVTFERRGDNYVLQVADNGRPAALPACTPEGVGLRSMGYRARLLEGRIEFERTATGGTCLKCMFPVTRGHSGS